MHEAKFGPKMKGINPLKSAEKQMWEKDKDELVLDLKKDVGKATSLEVLSRSKPRDLVSTLELDNAASLKLNRLNDILKPYLMDNKVEAEMIDDIEAVRQEQERRVQLLHRNFSTLQSSLDSANQAASAKVYNHLLDNQTLLKEVNQLRMEVKALGVENDRLSAQLDFVSHRKATKVPSLISSSAQLLQNNGNSSSVDNLNQVLYAVNTKKPPSKDEVATSLFPPFPVRHDMGSKGDKEDKGKKPSSIHWASSQILQPNRTGTVAQAQCEPNSSVSSLEFTDSPKVQSSRGNSKTAEDKIAELMARNLQDIKASSSNGFAANSSRANISSKK
jgi:hypothetical protein